MNMLKARLYDFKIKKRDKIAIESFKYMKEKTKGLNF